MKTSLHTFLYFGLLAFFLTGCSNTVTSQNPPTDRLVKGADINWLPQMEASGYKFYNDQGTVEECFKILKDHGINAIRLRTFVNPSDDKFSGHCNKDETVAMAVPVSYTHLRAHETDSYLVCRLLLEKK